MSDQPSIEQQLAKLIYDWGSARTGPHANDIAAAIIAAVNDGTCAPIVPERKPNLIRDAVLDALRDENDELRAALKAMLDGYKRAVQAGSVAVEGFVSAAMVAEGLLREAK